MHLALQIPWLTRPRYMDKLVVCQLNGGRKVSGVLRGFDPFLNLVLDEAHEETGERKSIGMVVRHLFREGLTPER